MALAPPPHGSRLQELGDRLLVHFRQRRSGVVFLGIWLTGWTLGGLSAVPAFLGAGTGSRPFLLFWLFGWALSECAVVVILAWKLFGREVLTVSPGVLELRREVGFFWITRRLDAGLVDGDVVAALMPTGEDEELRTDYRLELSYSGSTIRIGEGMSESQAQEIASIVGERFRPRSWWNDKKGTRPTDMAPHSVTRPTRNEMRTVAASMEASAPLRLAGWLVGAAVCAALCSALQRSSSGPITRPPNTRALSNSKPNDVGGPTTSCRGEVLQPARLRGGDDTYSRSPPAQNSILGQPRCGEHVTWTHWACSVRARSTPHRTPDESFATNATDLRRTERMADPTSGSPVWPGRGSAAAVRPAAPCREGVLQSARLRRSDDPLLRSSPV